MGFSVCLWGCGLRWGEPAPGTWGVVVGDLGFGFVVVCSCLGVGVVLVVRGRCVCGERWVGVGGAGGGGARGLRCPGKLAGVT